MRIPLAISQAFKSPLLWIALSVLFLVTDYLIGPEMMIPALYIIPVCLAAWHGGMKWGIAMALGMSIVRLSFMVAWGANPSTLQFIATFLNRGLVLLLVAFLVARTARQTRELQRKVKLLEGILPICSFCKKIRDEKSNWHQLEHYISAQSEASFTHGVCPSCSDLHFKPHLESGKKNYG